MLHLMGIPQSQNRLDCNAQVWAIKGQGRYAVVLTAKLPTLFRKEPKTNHTAGSPTVN